MLELNKWFFVLLLNFLVLLYVLNIILFKPLLKLFAERDNSIRGALEVAREMTQRREDAAAAMDRELKETVRRSNEIFEAMRKQGLERQKQILEEANRHAHDHIARAKGELKGETEKARQRLRGDVEKFSDEIVKKLVGT